MKHNIEEINLEIINFEPFNNEQFIGFVITWKSNIGFGEYTIYRSHKETQWHADSEHMDDSNKEFINKLMNLFLKQISIEE